MNRKKYRETDTTKTLLHGLEFHRDPETIIHIATCLSGQKHMNSFLTKQAMTGVLLSSNDIEVKKALFRLLRPYVGSSQVVTNSFCQLLLKTEELTKPLIEALSPLLENDHNVKRAFNKKFSLATAG